MLELGLPRVHTFTFSMTTQTPFQDASEQPGWEGVTLQPSGSNTQSQAFPFLPSASDSVFVPVNNGCFSQPQIFAPNPVPFDNNTAYNQLLNSPIIQHSYIPNNFIHDHPLHFPLSVSNSPLQHIHPSQYRQLCSPFPNNNNNFTHTQPPNFQPFAPQPLLYYNHHLHLSNSAPIQYVYLPALVHIPPPPVAPDSLLLPPISKSLPVITLIPILNLKSDFYAWDEGIATLLDIYIFNDISWTLLQLSFHSGQIFHH